MNSLGGIVCTIEVEVELELLHGFIDRDTILNYLRGKFLLSPPKFDLDQINAWKSVV